MIMMIIENVFISLQFLNMSFHSFQQFLCSVEVSNGLQLLLTYYCY